MDRAVIPEPLSPPHAAPPDEGEVRVLATILASEVSHGTPAEREAVAYTAVRRAQMEGKTLAELENGSGPQGSRRPFSTAHAPSRSDLEFARHVLSVPRHDWLADSFWEPRWQDEFVRLGSLYRQGVPRALASWGKEVETQRFRRYYSTAAEVRANWTKEGKESLGFVGHIELWASPKSRKLGGRPTV